MGKRSARAIALVVAFAMAIALAACAGNGESAAGGSSSAAASSASAGEAKEAAVESGSYDGILAVAYEDKLVVSGDEGDKEFAMSASTAYQLGDADGMYLDDTVSVKYHADGNTLVADEVAVVEHSEPALEFAGTLVDWGADYLVLANDSLTVAFGTDDDTYVVGDFSQGDAVELTYLGDLSENPYANVVAVVTEAQQTDTVTVHGAVAEIADGTLLLNIDSSDAYRFAMTGATKVTGAANEPATGDRVDIAYTGSLRNTPAANTINIVKQAQNRAYVINGEVADVAKGSFILKTDKAQYTFATKDATRFYGEKLAKGLKAEVTYTGALNSKPEAQVVYCAKAGKTSNANKDKKAASTSGSSGGKESAKQSGAESAKKPDSQSGGSGAQSADAQSGASEPASSGEAASDSQPADAAGEQAEEAQQEEAETEGQTAPSEEAEEPAEPEQQESGQPDEAAEQAQAEQAAAPAEPEPAAEPAPPADVKVTGQGTIVKGDEGKRTIVLQMKNGDKITLKYDGSTKISSGYLPEKGDVVKVAYGSNSMLLQDIQLVSREEKAAKSEKVKEPAADAGAAAPSAEAAGDDGAEE